MNKFTAKIFNFPQLKGISAKNLEEHIKLYNGYVKNTNMVIEKISELNQDSEKNIYVIGELNRRFSFEYNGMRNHELYFSLLEGGFIQIKDGLLKSTIEKTWGSFDNWLKEFKTLAQTRGIGWAMLYYDKKDGILINSWVDEQHLGQLQSCTPIIALDMWEHSYVADYQPSGKKSYIDDFFNNINWDKVSENFN